MRKIFLIKNKTPLIYRSKYNITIDSVIEYNIWAIHRLRVIQSINSILLNMK